MVLLGFDSTQWDTLTTQMENGQLSLAAQMDDLQTKLASLQSIMAEQLIVLGQIRDKLPEV